MAERKFPAPVGISSGIEGAYRFTGSPSYEAPPIAIAPLSERCTHLRTVNGRHFVQAVS
jgi:hypothetical protein